MLTFDRIIPLLVYKDIQAAHDFLVRAFGFESGGVERNADGHPMHGEVRAGPVTTWLHRVTAEHELASPSSREIQFWTLDTRKRLKYSVKVQIQRINDLAIENH